MKLTKRLVEFVKEVAQATASEENPVFTYDECISEYTDQIVNDDYSSVVHYANAIGITIPRALKGALK